MQPKSEDVGYLDHTYAQANRPSDGAEDVGYLENAYDSATQPSNGYEYTPTNDYADPGNAEDVGYLASQ